MKAAGLLGASMAREPPPGFGGRCEDIGLQRTGLDLGRLRRPGVRIPQGAPLENKKFAETTKKGIAAFWCGARKVSVFSTGPQSKC